MSALHEDPRWPRASRWLAGSAADKGAELAILGVPAHRGSLTPGRADLAPVAIRKALERYSPYDVVHHRDLAALRVEDRGDVPVADLLPAEAFDAVRAGVEEALAPSAAVVVLGGDNSITFPGVRALGQCGLITLDAHFDLRDTAAGLTNGNPVRALLDSGMPGRNIVQVGIQSFANSKAYGEVAREAGITVFTAEDVHVRGIAVVLADAFRVLGELPLYVDLDLDVLDRAFAPATPGSRPGGLTPAQVRAAARMAGANPRVRAMDLVEIDPEKDIQDMTSLAAAACLLEFASGMLER